MRALDRLATTRITQLAPRRRHELFRAVEAAEIRAELLHRHRAGAPAVPHPIALTPFLVRRRALPGLARLADLVHRVQAHAPVLWRADVGGFRGLCPVSEATAAWVARDPARQAAPWQLMIRPDVGLEAGPQGALAPVLFETNATGLAGLYNHAAGVRILRAEAFPRVYTASEARALVDPPDLLALVVRWVRAAARRLGRRRLRGVAFVEDVRPVDGYSEVPRLVAAFRAAGIPAEQGAATELRRVRGGVRLRDVAVDVVYRDLGLEDIGTPAGRALGGFLDRFDAGAALPGVAGEFSQKGLLECMGRPELARLFTPSERRLLQRSVPWTRVLGARRTEDLAGRRVDLPEFARRERERLLIKPNVGSSGDGRATRPGRGPRPLGGSDRPRAAGAGAVGRPGPPARHPPAHVLPPRRARVHRPLLLLPGSLLRAAGSRAPLPREPGARRQRRSAGSGRLRVPDEG